eukprot:1157872-Pelagomonas_calceolata.AAC.7
MECNSMHVCSCSSDALLRGFCWGATVRVTPCNAVGYNMNRSRSSMLGCIGAKALYAIPMLVDYWSWLQGVSFLRLLFNAVGLRYLIDALICLRQDNVAISAYKGS